MHATVQYHLSWRDQLLMDVAVGGLYGPMLYYAHGYVSGKQARQSRCCVCAGGNGVAVRLPEGRAGPPPARQHACQPRRACPGQSYHAAQGRPHGTPSSCPCSCLDRASSAPAREYISCAQRTQYVRCACSPLIHEHSISPLLRSWQSFSMSRWYSTDDATKHKNANGSSTYAGCEVDRGGQRAHGGGH